MGLVAMGMSDGSVSVWDLQRGVVSCRLGRGASGAAALTDVAFAGDGRSLFTSSSDKHVTEWDLEVRPLPLRV